MLEYKEMTSQWRIEREQILNRVASLKVTDFFKFRNKRQSACDHMKKVLECLEDAEKQCIKSEDIESKNLAEGCYETTKRVLKQISEDFKYFIEQDENLISRIESIEARKNVKIKEIKTKKRALLKNKAKSSMPKGNTLNPNSFEGENNRKLSISERDISDIKHSLTKPTKFIDKALNSLDDENFKKRMNVLKMVARTFSILGK